ncbi:MAG: hypothetical protein K2Y22_11695 [Candidatus Obscuribacterales bacterium]|nr:hypothetical protein [Candidatus Obscuribacterales bacterium]
MENRTRVVEKIADLCRTYDVKIGQDGELTTDASYGPYSQKVWYVKARTPTERELQALEYALSHSTPSQLLKKNCGEGIKFYFLAEPRCLGSAANWGFDKDNRPAIFVEPYETVSLIGLERSLMHELGHHMQFKLGWKPYRAENWSIAKKLGYSSFYNPKTNECGWLLKSKESALHLYKFNDSTRLWVRCDRQGRPMTTDGRIVLRQLDAQRITSSEMAAKATITPASLYFVSPMEMLSEAIVFYRFNSASRKTLGMLRPSLYEIVKELDQKEIDDTYGKGLYVRNINGVIALAEPKVLDEIASLEKQSIGSASNESSEHIVR